ncbi:Uncharacterized protein APZ42_033355 [Daphnia magna]|uniref:Uncharacterized protein n=1 Tax=Daphnia magna TaxID=35525 RepID=A0A164L653_9CRUS|nr:Uncharacterized protein APZ42_033355 [Daphnia magna]
MLWLDSLNSIPNPGTVGKGKKKKKLTEGQKRRRNRYTFEKERKKREAAVAAALQSTSSIPIVSERSVVFTSADLPLRRVVTVGPSVGPIFPTTSTVPFVTPNPPAPVREQGIPDNQKVPCHNYYSANHFPCEEERVRKFIQRRRERELEQVARQRAIEERRAREAKEREEKERGRRESKREEKDPKERRERGRKERAKKKKQNLHGKVKFMLPIRKEKEETVAEREERRAKERCERLKIAEVAKKKQEEEEEIERMRMKINFLD